jgi:hypothetical protein
MKVKGITYSTVAFGMMVLVCAFIMAFANTMNAQSCYLNPPQGPVAIYDEQLGSGWSTSTSNVSMGLQSAPGGQDHNYAISAQFGGPGATLEFSKSNVGTTFLNSLVFWVRKEDNNGNLLVTIRRADGTLGSWVAFIMANASTGYVPGFTPQQWFRVSVPLSDMGISSGTAINGVVFEGGAATNAYFDDIGVVTSLLQFPLAASTGTTPYTAPIAAILDHAITASQGNHGYYHRDGIMQAYDGESVNNTYCHYHNQSGDHLCDGTDHSIMGYLKDSSGSPQFNLPLLNFQAEDSLVSGAKSTLWYEGHSGYDYPVVTDTLVYPATIGTLCVASNRTSPDGNNDLWRNPSMCPYGTDSIVVPNSINNDSWDSWHQFYIVYPNQYNNVTYATFYMHVDDLETDVKSAIQSSGYWTVTNPNDPVALSGNWTPPDRPVGYHLHFEIRQNGTKVIDPYGDGTQGNFNVLWETRPQQ